MWDTSLRVCGAVMRAGARVSYAARYALGVLRAARSTPVRPSVCCALRIARPAPPMARSALVCGRRSRDTASASVESDSGRAGRAPRVAGARLWSRRGADGCARLGLDCDSADGRRGTVRHAPWEADCEDGEASPGADVGGVSLVPVPMWAGRARSQCGCGRGEPSPGAGVTACLRGLLDAAS